MSESGLRDALRQALVAMEAGPGAPCQQAQADGFPCPELGSEINCLMASKTTLN